MSISSLLNPAVSARPNSSSSNPTSSPCGSGSSPPSTTTAMASPATYYSDHAVQSSQSPASSSKPPRPRQPGQIPSAADFARARPKGTVYFHPFQHGLDAKDLHAVEEFRVFPFGRIEEYCRHIPYASGKKDFHEKTGREGFEVFQYLFKIPGQDREYHVMWDYNVGLVRMTPFFKCCGYSKTTPAKMLNLNAGLRDITHSITGGSIMAQGYWMPYACARAVCTTFCYHIAGAMIPLFGPDFPAACLPPNSPDYGHMAIDATLVAESTRETERMRRAMLYASDHAAFSGRPPLRLTNPTSTPRDRYDQNNQNEQSEQNDHMLPSPVEHERLPPLSQLLPPLAPSLALPLSLQPISILRASPHLDSPHPSRLSYLSSPDASDAGSEGGLPSPGRSRYTLPPLLCQPSLPPPTSTLAATAASALLRGQLTAEKRSSSSSSSPACCDAPSTCYPSPPMPTLKGAMSPVHPSTEEDDAEECMKQEASRARSGTATEWDREGRASDLDAAELLVSFSAQVRASSQVDVQSEPPHGASQAADEPMSARRCDYVRERKQSSQSSTSCEKAGGRRRVATREEAPPRKKRRTASSS